MAKFIDFSKFCLGPPNFKIFRGPLGPGPVGTWVNASLVSWSFCPEMNGAIETPFFYSHDVNKNSTFLAGCGIKGTWPIFRNEMLTYIRYENFD